jgi:hypothetical protein
MTDMVGIADAASCRVLHANGTRDVPETCGDKAFLRGVYHVKCFDAAGNLKWEDTADNLITNAGLNDVLNEYIRNTTQTAAWYMGLVDNTSFTAFAAGDVMSSHTGWIENAAYSNGTRPQWSPGASSGQSITNASTVNFSINANTQTIHGLFIVGGTGASTISATTGTLFSEAAFSGGNQAVNNGDTLQCTYTLSLASN